MARTCLACLSKVPAIARYCGQCGCRLRISRWVFPVGAVALLICGLGLWLATVRYAPPGPGPGVRPAATAAPVVEVRQVEVKPLVRRHAVEVRPRPARPSGRGSDGPAVVEEEVERSDDPRDPAQPE